MVYYAFKVLISALLIVAITELSKRNSGLAALLASLPLTSLLAFIWLHMEGTAASEIATLSTQIFWLVLPSLLLFMLLPLLIKQGWGFGLSLAVSAAVTAGGYLAMRPLLARFGVML